MGVLIIKYLLINIIGVRPFGVSLLICGWDNDRPYLFQCDPSGAYFAWKATAMGKNYINGKTFLEKRLVGLYFYLKKLHKILGFLGTVKI